MPDERLTQIHSPHDHGFGIKRRSTGTILGEISYSTRYNKYVFTPSNIPLKQGELQEILQFLGQSN